jgi:hypothetical protein
MYVLATLTKLRSTRMQFQVNKTAEIVYHVRFFNLKKTQKLLS